MLLSSPLLLDLCCYMKDLYNMHARSHTYHWLDWTVHAADISRHHTAAGSLQQGHLSNNSHLQAVGERRGICWAAPTMCVPWHALAR